MLYICSFDCMNTTMSFGDLARSRYSSRKYKADPVEEDKLDYILDAGRVAPSACNYQPWKIYVLNGRDNLEKIYPAYTAGWFRQAPVVLVICGDHHRSWKRADGKDHADIDVAILADHITLAAAEQGLGTCWICAFDREKVAKVLRLPDHLEPIVILPLGYPADKGDPFRHEKQRKPLRQIINRDFSE